MEIEPGKSVGQIQIGMGREEYERLLGPAVDLFKRTPDSSDQIVAYDSKQVHLTLNANGRIKSITVFRPQAVQLDKVQLLGRKSEDVEAELKRGRFHFARVDAGLWNQEAKVLLIEVDGIIDGVEVLADRE